VDFLPVLFEDHRVAGFRPLSWSQPVYELRCGVLNLRERVCSILEDLARAGGGKPAVHPGLLPRSLLLPLHPLGPTAAGVTACRERIGTETGVLFLSARLGPRWDLLAVLLGAALRGGQFLWQEADDLVAALLTPAVARDTLASWQQWEAQCDQAGCWRDATAAIMPWRPALAGMAADATAAGWQEYKSGDARLRWRGTSALPGELPALLAAADHHAPAVLGHIWDLVLANGAAITMDTKNAVATGRKGRQPYGLWPLPDGQDPPWRMGASFQPAADLAGDLQPAGVHLLGPESIWLAEGARIEPGAVIDGGAGPVVIDRDARIGAISYLEGPLYVGPGALIRPGARIHGQTSLGAVTKVAGEVAESILADYVNKQHDGFLGHAILGSWVNLGAGTTCSDLKNNYGTVRVDLGSGPVDSGQQFVGLLMGEHSKTAIGTQFNTGTCVGFACNVFGVGFPPKLLPNFSWGCDGRQAHDVERALATARIVMNRRGMALTAAHERLFRYLAGEGGGPGPL
jgi:UDP-N-acetylglucosamine diphosphorylase/glucosamine-1-phosphate N-acetyltransferase